MQIKTIAASALVATVATAQSTGVVAAASNATATIVTVVSSFETYCPEPTVITFNEECYTATAPGTLTVTNCPCTITTAVAQVTTGQPPAQVFGTGAGTGAGAGAGAGAAPTGGASAQGLQTPKTNNMASGAYMPTAAPTYVMSGAAGVKMGGAVAVVAVALAGVVMGVLAM